MLLEGSAVRGVCAFVAGCCLRGSCVTVPWSSHVGGGARCRCGCRLRVVLSQWCVRWHVVLLQVMLEGAVRVVCALPSGHAGAAAIYVYAVERLALRCHPKISFAIWGLCWRNTVCFLAFFQR